MYKGISLIRLESLCGEVARCLKDGIRNQKDHEGNGILFGGHVRRI